MEIMKPVLYRYNIFTSQKLQLAEERFFDIYWSKQCFWRKNRNFWSRGTYNEIQSEGYHYTFHIPSLSMLRDESICEWLTAIVLDNYCSKHCFWRENVAFDQEGPTSKFKVRDTFLYYTYTSIISVSWRERLFVAI